MTRAWRPLVAALAFALCGGAALAREDVVTTDARLNSAYQALLVRLRNDPVGREKLRAAQRAWLAYRDSECMWEGHAPDTLQPDVVRGCVIDMNIARTKQFRTWPDY